MSDFVKTYIETYQNKPCTCGKTHATPVEDVVVGSGVLTRLPQIIGRYGAKKVFLLADPNTYTAAGEQVCHILDEAGLPFTCYVLPDGHPAPDEKTVGSVFMHFDPASDIIIAVGSGVINDVAKLLATRTSLPFIIVATAPSMDGYASNLSSMAMDGLKVSLPSVSANVIIGDTDVLKEAPLPLLKAGLGDMLAKYVSLTEWKIAHLLLDEYYCDTVASLVQNALQKCVDNADGLLRRDPTAVQAVFEGLVIGGLAMNYAGISRPASGMEHYISHIWDMRALAMGTPENSHGTQCAIGTVYALKLYQKLKNHTPDRDKALTCAEAFDVEAWYDTLRRFIGPGAEAMIDLDRKEQKYDKAKHAARLDKIITHWDEIQKIIASLPSAEEIEALLHSIDAPAKMEDIGLSRDILPLTLQVAGDIRDKYVLARLLWDLGLRDTLPTEI